MDYPEKSLQRPRTGGLPGPFGASSDEMAKQGYGSAIETAWIDGTFGYFGFVNREMILLNGSKGSKVRREEVLKRAYDEGVSLKGPV